MDRSSKWAALGNAQSKGTHTAVVDGYAAPGVPGSLVGVTLLNPLLRKAP
jgi:hypothetical protein